MSELARNEDPAVYNEYEDLKTAVVMVTTAFTGAYGALLVGLIVGSLVAGWGWAATPWWWYGLSVLGILGFAGSFKLTCAYVLGERDESLIETARRNAARKSA